nr:PREDICTED: uncharacterized protein LOC107079300 [Lepisosteus oculatus]
MLLPKVWLRPSLLCQRTAETGRFSVDAGRGPTESKLHPPALYSGEPGLGILRSGPGAPGGTTQPIRSLLVDNASLALQTDSAHSEAARLRARCAAEESRTRHLENRVAWLKGVWQEAELQKAGLEEEVQGRLADLDHLHHSHQQAALALQQSARPLCDAVLLGAEREDGSGMELSQLLDEIRTHYDRLIALGGASRGAAADMPGGPLTQVGRAPCPVPGPLPTTAEVLRGAGRRCDR